LRQPYARQRFQFTEIRFRARGHPALGMSSRCQPRLRGEARTSSPPSCKNSRASQRFGLSRQAQLRLRRRAAHWPMRPRCHNHKDRYYPSRNWGSPSHNRGSLPTTETSRPPQSRDQWLRAPSRPNPSDSPPIPSGCRASRQIHHANRRRANRNRGNLDTPRLNRYTQVSHKARPKPTKAQTVSFDDLPS